MPLLFIRHGECLRCGQCCYMSKFNPKGWNRLSVSPLGKDTRQAENADRSGTVVITDRCYQLEDEEDGTTTCLIYGTCPELCKAFPRNPQERLPGCGYTFAEVEA